MFDEVFEAIVVYVICVTLVSALPLAQSDLVVVLTVSPFWY
jgi:hypothetical protein